MSMQRRAAFGLIGTTLMTAAVVAVAPEPTLAMAADANADEAAQAAAAATKQAAKERMEQRIAESKKNYRKPTDLVRERKENTDYSCVAATGSPCPEGMVPTVVQKTVLGALEQFK
jgi:acyl-CoA reductase-like NAD-dependent aldehyde dehydrogenase